MIFTYHPYQESRKNSSGQFVDKTVYRVNQASIICADSQGKPKPNQTVFINNSKKAFSNFMIENGAVNEYNRHKYDGTGGTSDITDPRWVPGMSSKSLESKTYPYGWYHQTYITTTQLKKNDDGDYSKIRTLKAEDDSIPGISRWASKYGALFEGRTVKLPDDTVVTYYNRPSVGEMPSPIMIRTDNGTVVKFYKSTDFTQSPIYWQDCVGRVTPVYNLIPSKIYYYKVFKNSTALTNIYGVNKNYGIISTEGQIRQLKFINIRNARDCGGWPTVDGNYKFKYDVLFRGSQLDGRGYSNGAAYTNIPYGTELPAIISDVDRKEFYKLDIQHEIDFRGRPNASEDKAAFRLPSSTVSEMIRIKEDGTPEETGISFYRLQGGASSYQGVYSNFSQFISYLNNIVTNIRNGKKVYLHCQQGKDRTGTYLALIFALCNINSDAITKDYELSSFWCSNTYTRFEFQEGDLSSSTSVTTSNATWSKFGASNTKTIQEAVQGWFRNNYSANGITGCETANDALEIIKETFLQNYVAQIETTPVEPTPEDPTPEPTPTPVVPEETTTKNLQVLYSTYVTTTIKDGDIVLGKVTETSGKTITTEKNIATITSTPTAAETVLGYSDVFGNPLGNTIDLKEVSTITPKVAGNLMYTKYKNFCWVDQVIVNDDRYYRLYRKGDTNFCASSLIWVSPNNPLKFTIPSFANKTVKFEIINPTKATGVFLLNERSSVHKVVSLTLNSKGQATYQPANLGLIFINFAQKEVSGYTTFTSAQLDEIQINYANVSAWSIPSVRIEKVVTLGGINQSIVYHQGYVIAFKDKVSSIRVIDVNNKSIVRSVPVTSVKTSSIHCNCATMMPIKYDSDDFFPMMMVSGDDHIGRVIRLVGSNPATVTAQKVCDWQFKYDNHGTLGNFGGMAATAGSNFYYLKWSTLLYKLNLDITNINNYVNRDIVVNTQGVQASNKIIKTGQDMAVAPTSRGDILITQYGPEPYYWKTNYSTANRYYLNGITLCSLSNGGNIVGHIPFYGLRNNNCEPDGITYAGDNTLYVVLNIDGQANLYKYIITFPEF